MSQKAVTDSLNNKQDKGNFAKGDLFTTNTTKGVSSSIIKSPNHKARLEIADGSWLVLVNEATEEIKFSVDSGGNIANGLVAIKAGGTGAKTIEQARVNLGLVETVNLAKNAYPITGGTLNGVLKASNMVVSQGDGRQHLGLTDSDGRARAWIYKDKGGDGIYINNGYDGGGEWLLSKNGELYCPGAINSYLRHTIQHTGFGRIQFFHQNTKDYILLETTQDGKGIYFVQRNKDNKNQWVLSFPQKNGTVATTDDIFATKNTSKKDPNGWWKCGDTGLIIQWGKWNNPYKRNDLGGDDGIPHGKNFTQNFAIPFSNTCFNIMPNITNSDMRDNINSPTITVHSFDKEKFIFQTGEHWSVTQNSFIYWFAIGY
ncbi:gp53-like domain-containing protein [Xenorhabdus bovienii]|nr:hypothetical protein [Xenorhabdus bovienii]CDG89662.1 hypothetical protein XBFFR1_310009 [Xenorhabdus bovienii str. feltiae France]